MYIYSRYMNIISNKIILLKHEIAFSKGSVLLRLTIIFLMILGFNVSISLGFLSLG